MRALPQERPENLTAPPDGQVLEELIGELQSEWGVPQYPQEYRITIKVAEGRSGGNGGATAPAEEPAEAAPKAEQPAAAPGAPRREKAPGMGRMASDGGEQKPARRRRRRRKRRGS